MHEAMKKNWIFGLAILVILAIALAAVFSRPAAVATDNIPAGVAPEAPAAIVPEPPVVVSTGNITITSPLPSATITSPVTITGQARVFENAISWRLKDSLGAVLASGNAMANAPDIGQFGPYSITTTYAMPVTLTGTIEVFDYSAKDGTEIDLVSIPVTF